MIRLLLWLTAAVFLQTTLAVTSNFQITSTDVQHYFKSATAYTYTIVLRTDKDIAPSVDKKKIKF